MREGRCGRTFSCPDSKRELKDEVAHVRIRACDLGFGDHLVSGRNCRASEPCPDHACQLRRRIGAGQSHPAVASRPSWIPGRKEDRRSRAVRSRLRHVPPHPARGGNRVRPRRPNYPPMPLPRTGNSGDTVSITTCTGGSIEQTWTYEWVGDADSGGWVLVSYSFNSKSCSSGG